MMNTKLIITLSFFLLTSMYMQAQHPTLSNNVDYKNMVKYLEQAQTFSQKGDTKNAIKRAVYARKFADKLIAKGHKADISQELLTLQSIENLKSSGAITQKQSTTSNTATTTMSSSDFRNAVSELDNIHKQVRALFNMNPASSSLKTYKNPVVDAFKKDEVLSKINELRGTDMAQQAYNKRHLVTLDKVEVFVTDLEGAMKTSQVYEHIDEAFEKSKDENTRTDIARFYIENAGLYITHLQKITPNNPTLTAKQQQMKSLFRLLEQRITAQAKTEQKRLDNADKVTELPVAGMSNASLENEFKRLAKPHLPSNVSITKVIITSSSWGINKDAIGRPIDRMMIAAMIAKGTDGKCYVRHFVFKQMASGNSFGATKVDNSWGNNKLKELDCRLL